MKLLLHLLNIFDDVAPLEETVAQPVAPIEETVAQPVAKPKAKSKGIKIVKLPVADSVTDPVADPVTDPVAEPVAEPVTEPIAEPVESAKMKKGQQCPNCNKLMNAKILSCNHKHICPKKTT